VLTNHGRLVVLLARLETRVTVRMRYMDRRFLGRIAAVDAAVRIARIVRRALMVVVLRAIVVDVGAGFVVRPVRRLFPGRLASGFESLRARGLFPSRGHVSFSVAEMRVHPLRAY
jgi:hypothetical protein